MHADLADKAFEFKNGEQAGDFGGGQAAAAHQIVQVARLGVEVREQRGFLWRGCEDGARGLLGVDLL